MNDPARQPRATVVIVNWNGAHLLPSCLDAVAAQRAPFEFRTVVVDNASSDNSVELVRERYPQVELLQSERNLGFAGGNNLALRQVTTPYAVLLNNDAVPEPGWLVELLAPFEQPGGERLGAVSGKVLFASPMSSPVSTAPGETTPTVAGPPRDVINNAGGVVLTDGYGADRGLGLLDDGRFDVAEDVLVACGNGMALRTTAGEEAGWFDDDFFVYYEDTDLSWRLRLLGWNVRYVPGARLHHVHAATSGIGSDLFRFHTERNRLLMLTKNASAPLVARAVLRFPLTTASLLVRQWPDTKVFRVRVRAFASFLRLLPTALRERRRLAARARVPRRDPERFLVPVADFQRDTG